MILQHKPHGCHPIIPMILLAKGGFNAAEFSGIPSFPIWILQGSLFILREKRTVRVWRPKPQKSPPWMFVSDVSVSQKMISDPKKTQVVGWLGFYKESVLWEIWIVNVSFEVEKERIILPITLGCFWAFLDPRSGKTILTSRGPQN